jgi:hydroxymethylbilane synthase
VIAGSRGSPLARAQFKEIQKQVPFLLEPLWVETLGDREKTVSLRSLGKTDFFTKELDEMLLQKAIRIAIHSAKDLPDPLPQGLCLIGLTPPLDSRDALVLRFSETFEQLPKGATIATSSLRREEAAQSMRSDLTFIDLRGTIEERLAKLSTHQADGVVVAEAALIRLELTHLNRIYLPGPTAPLQGSLAIVARSDDREARDLFAALFRP